MSTTRASRKACATAAAARPRARIVRAGCRASLGRDPWRCRSLQLLQIVKDGDQLVRTERHLRHQVAGLDVLRVGNPGGEVAGVSRQGTGGNCFPAADMRQVRAALAAGERTADRMEEAAAAAAKELLAADAERIGGAWRTLVLVIAPAAV